MVMQMTPIAEALAEARVKIAKGGLGSEAWAAFYEVVETVLSTMFADADPAEREYFMSVVEGRE